MNIVFILTDASLDRTRHYRGINMIVMMVMMILCHADVHSMQQPAVTIFQTFRFSTIFAGVIHTLRNIFQRIKLFTLVACK